jgi:YegS/Rv2252/BmrU family lipid kinase
MAEYVRPRNTGSLIIGRRVILVAPKNGRQKPILIVNPTSAAGRTGRRWPAIAQSVRFAGIDFDAVLTTRPHEATDITREAVRASRPFVVAVGGDGTLNEVVGGFFDDGQPIPTSSALGLLQIGTGGDTRRTLGIPANLDGAIRVLVEGHPRPMDVGRVTLGSSVRFFVNVAEAGIGAEVSERANRMSKALGPATYLVATLASLVSWRHKHLSAMVDGNVQREIIGQAVVVANCQYYGGGMRVAPQAIPDDGLLDVIIVGSIGKLEALIKARTLYKGTQFVDAGLRPKLELLRGARLELSSRDRVRVQVDGEVIGELPATFEVLHHAIRIMVPASMTPPSPAPPAPDDLGRGD